MTERCFWCNVDPNAAAERHEGPHLKWCLRYREPPLPAGVRRTHGSFVMDFPKFEGDPEQLPKADVMEVTLFLDGSVVYKIDGLTTVEFPSFTHEK